ncbi:uncharacterized protein LOC119687446 [Teleopsis dalmanni]|uniref:uncharacterized protein LOC119687446 n=1 Tax=Teleopsis dalmanni TaxID=139649 RepID=UPI0018CEC366|nr:uncharacterized protein LOC119687446 [Teleopsis dalmanni]
MQGNVDDVSLIRYIVDGLCLPADRKCALYEATILKEEKKDAAKASKYTVAYKRNNEAIEKRKNHCCNGESVDHKRADCKSETKCFRCNMTGHMSRNCPQNTKLVNLAVKEERLKTILLNKSKVTALIDTGADVTIITKSLCSSFKNVILLENDTNLYGLGNVKTRPIGRFEDDILIDGIQKNHLDLENEFFHVSIDEDSKKYTAFVTKDDLFQFNKTPFGFCNSPAALMRFVNNIFQDLINEDILELYMDDIIIYGDTADKCITKMRTVLERAKKWNLKIKCKTCCFLPTKIKFLGHIVEDGKVYPGEEKPKAVSKFPIPKNIKAVQSFLGLTGFFRRFIKNYAGIAQQLTNLLAKNVPWVKSS